MADGCKESKMSSNPCSNLLVFPYIMTPRLILALLIFTLTGTGSVSVPTGLTCDMESDCPAWQWGPDLPNGLSNMTGRNITHFFEIPAEEISGPTKDADGNPDGHFLYLRGGKQRVFNITSRWFNGSLDGCQIQLAEHSFNVETNAVRILGIKDSHVFEVNVTTGRGKNSWRNLTQLIGKMTKPFQLLIELEVSDKPNSHIAIDNIRLINCFPEPRFSTNCSGRAFQCSNKLCIDRSRVCDIQKDCPDGEDELQDCDKVVLGGRCDFENEADPFCGWTNDEHDDLEWMRQSGPNKYEKPKHDHTYQNISGHYLHLRNAARIALGAHANLNSPLFKPPPRHHGYVHSPFYNSCQIRVFYYMNGNSVPQLTLYSLEESPRGVAPREIWHKSMKGSSAWQREAIVLPRMLYNFRLQFVGTQGRSSHSFLALDDITLSPECFGIGLPAMPPAETTLMPSQRYVYTRYHFSTCEAEGSHGPTHALCERAYEGTSTRVFVLDQGPVAGVQMWRVNHTGLYSLVARGASGGQGARNSQLSRGAVARGVFNWTAGEHIYILVGQAGKNSCRRAECGHSEGLRGFNLLKKAAANHDNGSGGGGGGATYVFKLDSSNQTVLLLAAAGGGGLSMETSSSESESSDGRAENLSVEPMNGIGSDTGAGGGGGYNDTRVIGSGGQSLLQGAIGGRPCEAMKRWEAFGGFGGGGGACYGGGGGGGYVGGSASVPDRTNVNGEGGISYVSESHSWTEMGAAPPGQGSLDILTAFVGCGCEHLCVVVDLEHQETACICPDDQQLDNDNVSCQALPPSILASRVLGLPVHHLVIIIICAFVVMTFIGTAMFFLYHRYRRQKMQALRQQLFGNAELQLNRLRQQTGGMVTEYNPNYEFGGSSCTVQDLKEVPRDSLTLVKALGQGAFGEVYQGYLTNLAGDANEIPVAVKTLPELSASQAEMDFLMEALIMSKFNHPNIVSFIGVCFDKLPKFIVLELLPGGDLKSYLRESRPKPDRPSPLTMCDLLMLAMDVAKGCQYLEENHFIHRDIAARNCLLSTKGAGRVVKIADFGMARDIYRADYYRKGGKAMLPVKWMPPEAFLDGIFTSKTDVWSFGVLLWEVMSLGYMPYPGRGNQEVMQLVTSGGRLEPPSNCPGPVYHIMTQCWHSVPDERPNFVTILERIGYCLQDPDVIHASLPVFHRPPSTERDTTVMRPPETDSCLQVARPGDSEPLSPASTDYLIPIPALSNYSLSTERTDLHSPSSADSDAGLLDLDARSPDAPPVPTESEPAPILVPESMPFSGQAALSRSCDSSPRTKKRAGGYTSVPTYDENPPPPPQFSSSVPEANIARQRPRSKPPGQSLMSLDRPGPLSVAPQPNSLSALDVSALARQHPTTPAPPYPYANVDVNSVSPLAPKSVVNDKMDTYIIGNHFVERCNEKEINC